MCCRIWSILQRHEQGCLRVCQTEAGTAPTDKSTAGLVILMHVGREPGGHTPRTCLVQPRIHRRTARLVRGARRSQPLMAISRWLSLLSLGSQVPHVCLRVSSAMVNRPRSQPRRHRRQQQQQQQTQEGVDGLRCPPCLALPCCSVHSPTRVAAAVRLPPCCPPLAQATMIPNGMACMLAFGNTFTSFTPR